MAVTNHERVGKGLELLRAGLGPFVERELKQAVQAVQAGNLSGHRRKEIADDPMFRRPSSEWDVAVVLRLIWDNWHDAFSGTLGRSDRSLVSELRDHRNQWAHQEPFSSDDAYRALDSVQRLLTSISAPQVREIDAHKQELLRVRFQEQVRGERRRTGRTVAAAGTVPGLKAWRDVVTPHQDVASGRYQQAEFAADLWQVFLGEGTDEYRDPAGVLSPHLSDRQPAANAGRRRAAAYRTRRRPRGATADQLRRRQDPLDAGAVPPVLRRAADQSGRHRRGAEERGHGSAACRAPRRAGRKPHLAGQPGHQAGRHRGAHPVGRAGVAARRTGSVRARGCRRRACHQSPGTVCASCSSSPGRAWY